MLGNTMIIYYCISPNCKNECGKKKPSEEEMRKDRDELWRNHYSPQPRFFCETKFCDDEGNVIRFDYQNNQT